MRMRPRFPCGPYGFNAVGVEFGNFRLNFYNYAVIRRLIGCRTSEFKPDGESSCGRPLEQSSLRSSGSMKQEEKIDSFI